MPMPAIYEGLGSAATTRKHYAPHCPTPEENADMASAMANRAAIIFVVGLGAYCHDKGVQGREKARDRGCHCTYLEGFISITASDCEKTLDKVPEEHGMRSTKTTNDQAMTELVMPE